MVFPDSLECSDSLLGSVPAENRFEIVRKFNEDPTIDVLLLTTSVGGLGLNLTGADTVIFLEHDWNRIGSGFEIGLILISFERPSSNG